MAYVKTGKYEYTIISEHVSLNDINSICEDHNYNKVVSIIINHSDNNISSHISGIMKSTLCVSDTISKKRNIVIHFINTKTKIEFKVPLNRDKDGNIDWT